MRSKKSSRLLLRVQTLAVVFCVATILLGLGAAQSAGQTSDALLSAAPVPGHALRREFSCNDSMPHTFVVPDSVTSLQVEAHGGRGGHSDPSKTEPENESGAGGSGAIVSGTIPVTPGQKLTIWVGCAADARSGFGGGGKGGQASRAKGKSGGTGGSASAIFDGNMPLIVAGGGGGGGGAGARAGSTGGAGGNAGSPPQPGKGGVGKGAGKGGCAQCSASTHGTDGKSALPHGGGGGGGGGGYSTDPAAQGGGGGTGATTGVGASGGGGGAGASYAVESTVNLAITNSSRRRHGVVILSWGLGNPLPVDSIENTWTFACSGAPVTWQVPSGVTQIVMDVRGGNGADAENGTGGFGGPGGRVVALTPVAPGQTLTIYVGCGAQGRHGAYGFHSGGEGGSSGWKAYNGGGGGGSSLVAIDESIAVIAGGGGGGGGNSLPVGVLGIGNGGIGMGANGSNNGSNGSCPGAPNYACPIPQGGSGGENGGLPGNGGDGQTPSGSGDSLVDLGGGGGGGGGAGPGSGGQAGNTGAWVNVYNPTCQCEVPTNFAAVGAGGGGGGSVIRIATVGKILTSPSGPDGQVIITAGNYVKLDVFSIADQYPATASIPANAYGISVEAIGASGQTPPGQGVFANSGLGGMGGIVEAVLPVNPGVPLAVLVGQYQDLLPDVPGPIGGTGGTGHELASDGGHGGGGSALTNPSSLNGPFILVAGGGGGGGGGAVNAAAPVLNDGGNGGDGGLLGSTAGSGSCCSGGGGGVEEGNAPLHTGANGTDGNDSHVVASGGGGGAGGGNVGGGQGHGSSGQGGGGGGAGGISSVNTTDVISSSYSTASNPGGGSVIIKYLAGSAPEITSGPPPGGVMGQPYSFQLTATGRPAPGFSVSAGSLPPGLHLDAGSGVISGTPQSNGTFSFSIEANNNIGMPSVAAYVVKVVIAAPVITSGLPPILAFIGQPYNFQVTATGNPTPTFALAASGSLPPGLSLNSQTGLISGTPVLPADNYEFQIVASNGVDVVSPDYFIQVNGPPTITSGPPPKNAQVGVSYGIVITTAPEGAEFFLQSGQLPPGITLTSTGFLGGTPTTAGVFQFQVRATNGFLPDAISPVYEINVAPASLPSSPPAHR